MKKLFCWRSERPRLFLLNPPDDTDYFGPHHKGLTSRHIFIYLLCFSVSLLTFPTLSYPKVYKWVDEKGNIHFTDNPSEIPPGITTTVEEFFVPQSSSPTPKPESKKEKKSPESKKIQGKSQKEDWQTKLSDIQKEIEKKKAKEQAIETELTRPKYKQLVRRERLMREELEELKEEIASLEKEQTDIEEKINAAQ